ncbi:MAG: hypothetical protein LBJ02_12085 [Bifidobacteriaceae bacterium]|nr:hypothetical protein [Bifidobacteriaceae bacterium]
MPYFPLVNGANLADSRFSSLEDYLKYKNGAMVSRHRICNALGRVGPADSFPWMTLVVGSEVLAPALRYSAAAVSEHMVGLASGLTGPEGKPDVSAYGLRCLRGFIESLLRSRTGQDLKSVAEQSEQVHEDVRYHDWQLRLLIAAAMLNATYFFSKGFQAAPINRWEEEPVFLITSGKRGARGYLEKRWDVTRRALERARDALEDELETVPSSRIQLRTLCELVRRAIADMTTARKRRIGAGQLLALTEAAWYFLLEPLLRDAAGGDGDRSGENGYLAWPDLLIPLGFQGEPDSVRSRPSLTNPKKANDLLREELSAATKRRARSYGQVGSGAPSGLASSGFSSYKVYADVLAAEARIHSADSTRELPGRKANAGSTRGGRRALGDIQPLLDRDKQADPISTTSLATPYAVAFATTLDVELELACRHYHPDVPLIVVLPMTIINDSGERSRASSMWMGYLIEGPGYGSHEDTLAEIVAPRPKQWFLFEEDRTGTAYATTNPRVDAVKEKAAVIIRLTGSPLVSFPKITDQMAPEDCDAMASLVDAINVLRRKNSRHNEGSDLDLTGQPEGAGADAQPAAGDIAEGDLDKVAPATVLEEHHALQLSFADIRGPSGGLPAAFTSLTPQGFWRYWALLGVQASNEAIRYRLIAQLIGPRLSQSSEDQPSRSGVAINSAQLSAKATELLQWSEFDVIKDGASVEAFSSDLQHYLDHIRSQDPTIPLDRSPWQVDKECELKGTKR